MDQNAKDDFGTTPPIPHADLIEAAGAAAADGYVVGTSNWAAFMSNRLLAIAERRKRAAGVQETLPGYTDEEVAALNEDEARREKGG